MGRCEFAWEYETVWLQWDVKMSGCKEDGKM